MNNRGDMSFGGYFSDEDETEETSLCDFENDEHWFVDAADDEELQDMFREKHFREFGIRTKRRVGALNCPSCFVTLCNDYQRHEFYHNQYRAMFVTRYCVYNNDENRIVKGDNDEETNYKIVRCKKCEVEVGAYDPIEEIYYFFEVLPGR